jgi:hypothetical protein
MTTLRGPGVKSVGKPDAGNRHVRFDERGLHFWAALLVENRQVILGSQTVPEGDPERLKEGRRPGPLDWRRGLESV